MIEPFLEAGVKPDLVHQALALHGQDRLLHLLRDVKNRSSVRDLGAYLRTSLTELLTYPPKQPADEPRRAPLEPAPRPALPRRRRRAAARATEDFYEMQAAARDHADDDADDDRKKGIVRDPDSPD